jgi:Ca2+-transporting ATPase
VDELAYHDADLDELFKQFDSSERGISSEEAARRIQKYGKNELKHEKKASLFVLFLSQFRDFLMYLLLFATAISLIFQEYLEAVAMMSIAVLSAILGFVQEYRASRAMEALERLSAPHAKVIRDGVEKKILASDLVPGDIFVLEAGDIVPADGRIMESYDMKVEEASLTGESVATEKSGKKVSHDSHITEQHCMVFMATSVTYGKAKCMVTGTGMSTEIGKIASSIQSAEETGVPLQLKFKQMARQIGTAVIFLITVIFFTSLINRDPAAPLMSFLGDMLIFAMSMAVAAIPNSLPAIVTISLAIGAKVLARKNMIIKKLPAAESLGSATVICTDKTGTLTKNEMTVTKMLFSNKVIDVSGSGYAPDGKFSIAGKEFAPGEAEMLFRICRLCNGAEMSQEGGKRTVIGDPTEGSLLVLAEKAKLGIDYKAGFRLVQELSFDSERKRMSAIYADLLNKRSEAYVKGAPDLMLERCDRILVDGKVRKITPADRKRILDKNHEFATSALRVLSFAYKWVESKSKYDVGSVEKSLIFVGLVGMIDPPRDEVKDAILDCKKAGIRVMVITGDHADTARAVAEKIGLYQEGDVVLTGAEMDLISDEELDRKIERIRIIARALPIQKLRIVGALQKKGHIVAMTGDGVNDAPAIKKADIGIAMGITGTDVAKEVSEGVLADDNFATIVNAVREGRNIYDRIIKSTRYLLACNTGEVVLVFTSILVGLPLPMMPLQILLMNLFTDGLPAIALGTESADDDIMTRPPRDPADHPINIQMLALIVLFGVSLGLGSLVLYAYYFKSTGDVAYARTIAFTTLVMLEMFAVLGSRSLSPFRKLNPFTNRFLLLAVASSVGLHLLIVYWAPLQSVFQTVALGAADWLRILALSSVGYFVMEFSKFVMKSATSKKVVV